MATLLTPAVPQMPVCAHAPRAYAGPSRAEVLELRRRYAHPSLFTLYREPLMLVEGYLQWLFDETGRRYLDMFAGIATVSCGHAHPEVVRRVQEQAATLQHLSNLYLHPNLALFTRALAARMPAGLDVTYLVNSGSEANDLAVTMARLYTGRADVVAVKNGYHGGSPSSMALNGLYTWKLPTQQSSAVHHAACPDPYRSAFRGSAAEVAAQSVDELRSLIRAATPGQIAAFIAEPIQGVGGVTLGAPAYLRDAFTVAREHGGLCISDEVQTGFGRTGDHYWGFERSGVVPDIVTTAKGIGNGAPLAAVTTRREIAETLTQRLHFNTFGGNPVSVAAGLAVLDIIDRERLQANAQTVGGRLRAGLDDLMGRHRLIGDVRGHGLMLGVELVRDRAAREPAVEETLQVLERLRECGVLMGKGGLDGNVLRIKPPLCITAEDADFALEALDYALAHAASA
ncbi:MAG TPA: aspartate aminotransferase family protein [Gemmatimonadales bacterium]|jgi:alanine-glyoxylate transaminase/(R)-3-amino-2-methylpropionate-pyruvate transaminase|nr:aspartate aminotransferase family protein [Gemmatimonadales bacterium]